MVENQSKVKRVAVVQWSKSDEIAEAIHHELCCLGYSPFHFQSDSSVPQEADVVFSFAPYGKFLPIVHQIARIPAAHRPIFVHWNTEGIPDLRIPWSLLMLMSNWRSWIERLIKPVKNRKTLTRLQQTWLDSRMLRFRYVGDYYYAHHKGILNIFADSSAVYAQLHNSHGLSTIHAPWGSTSAWYEDLNLERDIDVFWMGKRGSKRRSNLLDQIFDQLRKQGVKTYIADNKESPFVFGKKRTELLNRSKITLNVTRTWYDDNFSRFAMAAPNRSLIVSEEMLPHCPAYIADVHYVASPPDQLATTILDCLRNYGKRKSIVENAYRLSTETITFENSIRSIMNAVQTKASTNRSG